jgi:hypothetical protein
MPHDISDFEKVYSAVTDSLIEFADAGRDSGRITLTEARWFEFLVAEFRKQFLQWEAPVHPEIESYLSLFDSASRPVRVAGHAFLHVGYDLPRVLASSFSKFHLTRSRLRTLFLRPAPLFREIFLAQARRGSFGLFSRPLGFVKPMEILAYWLLALRSVAWIHSEILADAGTQALRRDQERALAVALLESGRKAMQSVWIFSIPKLDNSDIFQVTPAPLFFLDVRMSASIAAVLLLTIMRIRNESIAARIAAMGQYFSAIAPKHMEHPRPDGGGVIETRTDPGPSRAGF